MAFIVAYRLATLLFPSLKISSFEQILDSLFEMSKSVQGQ